MEVMRAVWLREFGGPEVLRAGEAPDPVPEPGQVLITVAFANTTFVETQFRAGGMNPFGVRPPVIPGNGVGGVVTAGADGNLVGRQVVTSTGGTGGYAERVAVPARDPFLVPDGLALDAAVALLADGRTAKALAHTAALEPGQRVLVEAAAGGVGSLLVQLAKNAGATVVAATGPGKVDVARELGADVAVDYSRPGWAEEAGEVDVVFDGVGGETGATAFSLLRRGGRLVMYGLASGAWTPVSDDDAAAKGVTLHRGLSYQPDEMRAFTEAALADGAAGKLTPLIGQRFPLEQAADAHRAIENRATVGKTLLVV